MGTRNGLFKSEWRIALGLCAGIIVAAISLASYAGCAGDCMTCHASLKDSAEHKSLKTCIKCHTPSDEKPVLTLGGGPSEGCAEDCFQCHTQWPKDGYHAPLETCSDCHAK